MRKGLYFTHKHRDKSHLPVMEVGENSTFKAASTGWFTDKKLTPIQATSGRELVSNINSWVQMLFAFFWQTFDVGLV